MPALPPPAPPAQIAPAPQVDPAVQALLEAFDYERELPAPPSLKGQAALRYGWVRTAATFDPAGPPPPNPFRRGAAHQEVAAFRQLMGSPGEGLAPALATQSLREPGTALAFWRWGRRQVRAGHWGDAVRRAWEDRLVTCDLPLVRGYGFRHALCWALAQGDETRFTDLRAKAPEGIRELLPGLQRLFGLIGGVSPVMRLWSLADLGYQDVALDQLGASRIWISPAPAAAPLPTLPAGTAWVIPSETGLLDAREAALSPPLAAEGAAVAERLRAGGLGGWFAPSRTAFEALGLDWFPILIDLDAKGRVTRIRMGDAAPAQP